MHFQGSTMRGFWAIGLGAIVLAACGSRTPLGIDPQDGSDPDFIDPIDSGTRSQCFTSSQPVGEIPIDLYFMMDKSSSMNMFDQGQTVSRWTAVSQAMKAFINSPKSAGLSAGIAFFPRADVVGNPLCSSADYAFPVVPIGPLPGVVPAIAAGIGAQILGVGTPTRPALQGAHVYARSQAQAGHMAAVVLVTDGQPRGCDSLIESTAIVATTAAGGNPSIRTYVLGVGPSLGALHAIAEAGGTGRAYLVESGGEAELTLALDAIRTSALACGYVIPEKGRDIADKVPAKVSTRVGRDGEPNPVSQVADFASCNGLSGWYYERPPMTGDGNSADKTPTRVTLCPATCDDLLRARGSHLDVVVGCNDDGGN
ncbi:MAG: vWA domain-containing protein [Polyangiaceae bacterium]